MIGARLRFIWPVALISLGLVAMCAFTAAYLLHEQLTIAGVLRENVASRRAAVELEECLHALIAQETAHVEEVSALHTRVYTHLGAIRQVADEPEEQRLLAELETSFARYIGLWRAMPPPGHPGHEAAFREASRVLDSDVLKPCQELRRFTGRRLQETTDHHELVLRRLAWGMAGVGGLGGFAGLVLGFGVARGLSRSLRRLHFRIRDAAGKLGPELPDIVLTEEGNFRGLHEQIDQLTARIELIVQELQQREREVLRTEQLAAVGQLAAGVAHEIRNPLTSIKMLAQTGQEDSAGLPPEDLRVIVGEVRRMERSLQAFLDFARPPKPERRPVDLAVVVRTVLGLIRGRAEKQRVRVRVDAPDGFVLTADPGQLQQVLVNLILNALDAMPSGGTLSVSARWTAVGGVALEVADTGPGIAPEVMPKLFQPFVSGKDTGIGLGLVISRRIVEDHGGTIIGANRSGSGAVFTVFLPPQSFESI
ncbi:MAG TPA: ATP-binding protein [Gemmataceae bacterium]|nr:ATP-binding protein [Gemmataceae bacterium]